MSYKRGLAVVSGCVIAALVSFAATYPRFYPTPAPAAAPVGSAPAKAAAAPALTVDLPGLPSSTSPLAWAKLTNAEHVALAPFASQWDSFSDERKRKWLKIASRYPKMTPEAQKILHERMTEWVHMTPEQRRVARENYQVSKELPREARQNAWKAYQQLPEEQKQKLAQSEHKRRPTVVSAPPTGKTEIKDINRLVNGKDRLASVPVPPPTAGASAGVSGGTAPAPGAPGIPATGSFVPATPTPVAPSDAPSIFNGS
ncbi:DUF3106 domain-containing protein [Paraburkholderia sp. LEh10]|uniref:DUF3106 domain-containing protein n=1 Tax=Paraburkholderia sp. LEh10 TaxID=2821353 RepID=UPI001AE2F30C|nr:DUF3106 domain-containing protein [Paraburkholderia sp. LEh10]MBP0595215.1 DUF3106 domain-containing protein [Paraburkholderia sp. LEh10]